MRKNRNELYRLIKNIVDNFDGEFTLRQLTDQITEKYIVDNALKENHIRYQLKKLAQRKRVIPYTNTNVYQKIS